MRLFMHIMVVVMRKIKSSEDGFIPMLIVLVLVIVTVIVLAYLRASHASH